MTALGKEIDRIQLGFLEHPTARGPIRSRKKVEPVETGEPAPDLGPRLVTGPAALRYLGGERPERFGIEAIRGKRQRLYDRRAIDAALDRIAALAPSEKDDSTPDALAALVDEWR